MANTIQIKRNTSGAPSSLDAGELAVNLTDKKLWVGNAAGNGVLHLNDHLPLAGGTITGALALSTNTTPSTAGGEAFLYKHASNGTVLSGYNASIETGSAGSRAVRLSVGNTGTVTIGNNLTVAGSCTFAALSGTTAGFSGKATINGADNNGGTADFSVATGGGTPQISWRSNGQVQIGSTDMNWNSKIVYDGATRFYTWANDIVIGAGYNSSGATTSYDIALYAATSHHTPAEYLRCDGSAGQVVLSKPLKVNNNVYIDNTTYIDVPTNSGTSSALIWRRLDHTIVGRIVADASNLKTQFWDNNSAVMTIGSDSVGIGSTAPNKTLSVVYARTDTNVTEDGLSSVSVLVGYSSISIPSSEI